MPSDDTLLYADRGRTSYLRLLAKLILHLAGTAVAFLAFATLVWLVGYALHELNTIFPFPLAIFKLINKLETWSIYLDVVICAIVFLASAARFFKGMWEA